MARQRKKRNKLKVFSEGFFPIKSNPNVGLEVEPTRLGRVASMLTGERIDNP